MVVTGAPVEEVVAGTPGVVVEVLLVGGTVEVVDEVDGDVVVEDVLTTVPAEAILI